MDLQADRLKESMIIFGTKAETLSRLHGRLKNAVVQEVFFFSLEDWKKDHNSVIAEIVHRFPDIKIICRSSALDEDTSNSSNAGKYKSIANILSSDSLALRKSIEEIFNSYQSENLLQQILIQPQLTGILLSGVIFTADLESGSPYYNVNYDDQSGSTDSVTSGKYNGLKTYIHFKNAPFEPKDQSLKAIIDSAKELETLFGNSELDIEFAITTALEVVIFQVRPLNIRSRISAIDLGYNLLKIFKKAEKLNQPHPGLYGERTVFGVMPDWNPAEIIGVKPRMLALSLYKELVTDSIWAYQRNNYGYKNLRSFPLLVSFFGQPYIDVRVSFNSFIPQGVPDQLAHKLSNHYVQSLLEKPFLHDKVEFGIVFSCFYLDLPSRIEELKKAGFSKEERSLLQSELLKLTNNIIDPERGIYKADIEKVNLLDSRRLAILNSSLSTLDKIYWLLEECKRYGTLPFAGLARAGFIAIQFLKSFVSLGIITQEEYDQFLGSLNTVSKQLNSDHRLLEEDVITKEQFLSIYGHLRPGTYDILSARYDEGFEKYFAGNLKPDYNRLVRQSGKDFLFTQKQLATIDSHLQKSRIGINAQQLILYIRETVEQREASKFIFTRCLSDALKLITTVGERYGISKDELSYLDVTVLMKLYSHLDQRDVPDILKENIELNKNLYAVSRAVRLPHLITVPEEVYAFYLGNDEPNFITQKRITKEVESHPDIHNRQLENKIVFIPSADPGFDWVFSKQIAGLVTKYGGANSHMAIRCAELAIPAVVGCGEQNYSLWSKASMIEMDCGNKKVLVIN